MLFAIKVQDNGKLADRLSNLIKRIFPLLFLVLINAPLIQNFILIIYDKVKTRTKSSFINK